MLIKDQEGLRKRWAEHFSTLLNKPSTVDPTALEQVPQQPTLNDLDLPPSMDELSKALKQTNSGTASGKDGIPAEIYKATGPRAMEVFLDIIQSIWDQEKMPDDFRDALIVALYKNKGSKADCGNYRGISLLSIAGKIFARIILNRLIAISEANLPEAQCGFRPGRSTVDMIFTVRQVQEKCHEQNLDLYSVFIDLTKAFDTVLSQAVGNTDKGVYVRFRYDGCIFDLRRLSAKTNTPNSLIQEALFADDCALMAHKPGDLQAMLNSFSDASKQFGLSISLEKTEVLFQRAPNSVAPQPAIFIDDVELKVVDSFKYLGSMISVDGSLDKEIAFRISKASQALGRLRNRLLNHHNVTLDTKLKVYRAVVLSSLLYGCETWTVYRRHLKQLERFHQRALHSILGIRWQDRATNTEVFKRTNCISIEAMLLKSCLRWTGHIYKDGGSTNSKATTVWRARAGSQETGPPLQTFQGHSESRLAMVWHPTNWTGCCYSEQTALAHTFTICVICARGRASPSSTVRQRTPPLGSLYPSDKCELPVPRLRTALQVQDRPAEPLPYPQIRGTDNVILETEGPPWWWWAWYLIL